MAAAVLLLAADLLPFSRRLAPMVDGRALTSEPSSVRLLRTQAAGARIISVGPDFMNLFPPNLPMAWGLANVHGSDSFCPRWQWDVLTRLDSITQGGRSSCLTSPVADFLAARFVLTGEPLAEELGLVLVGQPDAYLYLRPKGRPRATLVGGVRAAEEQAALETLFDPAFDASSTVVLERAKPAPPAQVGATLLEEGGPNVVRVYCLGQRAGWLVLADTFFAGWRAFVDGRQAGIEQANYAYRAVPVEPGKHTVVMAFAPSSVTVGFFLAGLGVAAMCALLAARVGKTRDDL